MVSNRTIQVRMTRRQYDQIRLLAQNRGFNSLSAYMRYVALDQDFVMRQKIAEIHRHLLGDQAPKKQKRGSAM